MASINKNILQYHEQESDIPQINRAAIQRISKEVSLKLAYEYDEERAVSQIEKLIAHYGDELQPDVKDTVGKLVALLRETIEEERRYMPYPSLTLKREQILKQLDIFLIFWTNHSFVDYATETIA